MDKKQFIKELGKLGLVFGEGKTVSHTYYIGYRINLHTVKVVTRITKTKQIDWKVHLDYIKKQFEEQK